MYSIINVFYNGYKINRNAQSVEYGSTLIFDVLLLSKIYFLFIMIIVKFKPTFFLFDNLDYTCICYKIFLTNYN